MNIKKYRKLRISELTGNLSKNEKELLDNWLAQSSDNINEYEKIKSIWEHSAPGKTPSVPDIDTEWNALYNKLGLDKIQHASKESIFDKIYFYFQSAFAPKWRPALGGALAIILLMTSLFILNNKNSNTRIKMIATGNKELKEVQLPDGSTVKLNSGSNIQFFESFDENMREVKLNGEAFFL